ncbi:MAG: hypothetical protein KME05_23405, partial [Gloeocapsa sp. UFS-A4-WI-NPMV-4B04]|nr:hypothetical protein [Gloeocapsa sp. UFS-A4-WI-NPMV-4B04]
IITPTDCQTNKTKVLLVCSMEWQVSKGFQTNSPCWGNPQPVVDESPRRATSLIVVPLVIWIRY